MAPLLPLESQATSPPPPPNQPLSTTGVRLPPRRRLLFLRRRKLPVVRLGGMTKKPGQRRGIFLVRMFRRVRLRWLKLHYTCILKKLKEYYHQLVKDLRDAGASLETFQQRVLMETSFAVPVMGVSLSSFPTVAGSDRPRSLIYM